MKPLFIEELIVGLDPGRKATGVVIFTVSPALGVVKAKRVKNPVACDLIWELSIQQVYMEGYRLYPWVSGSMRWDELREVRMIGAVEEICRKRGIPLAQIPPHQSKALVKDEDLVKLGTWSRNAHINDAFRVFWASLLGGIE